MLPKLTKKQLAEQVKILCYNKWETMTRKEGIEKYYEAMVCCEGSERDRYTNIYSQLMEGAKVAYDSCTFVCPTEWLHGEG